MRIALTHDMVAARARGRAAIDKLFAPHLAEMASPAAALRALKAAEAARLVSGVIATSPLLSTEAMARDLSEGELARLILDRSAAWQAEIGAVEAHRQAAQIAIDAAANPVAIDAIVETYRTT